MLGVVLASDNNGEGVEDEKEDELKRSIDVEIGIDGVKIESTLNAGKSKYPYQYIFKILSYVRELLIARKSIIIILIF